MTGAARWRAFAELARVPNLFTAGANVVAGWAVVTLGAGVVGGGALAAAFLASMLLYAGGVVLNDWFDRGVDALERPERPIPSGRVTPREAGLLGAGLLAGGILFAAAAAPLAGAVALVIAGGVIAYDGGLKRWAPTAGATMGTLRGLNVAMGMALAGFAALARAWPVVLLAAAHVLLVTLVARNEVVGGGRGLAVSALVVDALIALALGGFAANAGPTAGAVVAGAFAVAFLAVTASGWGAAAFAGPTAERIRRGVTRAVLATTLLDAALAAAFAGPVWGLGVAALLVPATLSAKLFDVT